MRIQRELGRLVSVRLVITPDVPIANIDTKTR
jgi:hypothetical protein